MRIERHAEGFAMIVSEGTLRTIKLCVEKHNPVFHGILEHINAALYGTSNLQITVDDIFSKLEYKTMPLSALSWLVFGLCEPQISVDLYSNLENKIEEYIRDNRNKYQMTVDYRGVKFIEKIE